MRHKNFFTLQILFIILLPSTLFTYCKPDEPIQQVNNWQTIYQDSTVWMSHIRFLDKNTGFVLAGNTNAIDSLRGRQFIFKTTDAGRTWAKYASKYPTYNDVARIIVPLNENILIAGCYSLYKSTDNGLNWNILNPNYKGLNIFDIYMKDSLNWILADGNDITFTNDGGLTFKKVLTTDFNAPFSHLSFPTNMVGYACGGANDDYTAFGFIAKTIDGGQSWNILNPEPWNSNNKTFPTPNAIQFITEQIGFIFTINGEIYKTIDGGCYWTIIPKIISTSGYFFSEDKGYSTNTKNIYKTNDGGKTWDIDFTIPSNSNNSYILDMCFLKSGEGFAITPDSKIIKKNY